MKSTPGTYLQVLHIVLRVLHSGVYCIDVSSIASLSTVCMCVCINLFIAANPCCFVLSIHPRSSRMNYLDSRETPVAASFQNLWNLIRNFHGGEARVEGRSQLLDDMYDVL